MAKVIMDGFAGTHVSARIRERVHNSMDQEKVVGVIKKMLNMEAPKEAVGLYSWHVNIGRIGRVVLRGNLVRTFLSFNENFPEGTSYRISGGAFVKVF